jgi:hypothetical protein
MHSLGLEVRQTGDRGRGLFATRPIAAGTLLMEMKGWLARGDALKDSWLCLQVDHDLWLCSHGDLIDDCGNHSCDPNAGFTDGRPVLFALRDIEPGEEITWDYSTSLSEAGWTLDCRCGSPMCRGTVRGWHELTKEERDRLRPIALQYLRSM